MGRLDLLFCFSRRAFVTLPFGVWGLIPWSLGKTTQLPKNYMKNKNPNECDVASDECIMHCAVLCRLVALVSAFKVASIILIKKKNHTEILVDRHRILLGCQNRGLDTFFDFFFWHLALSTDSHKQIIKLNTRTFYFSWPNPPLQDRRCVQLTNSNSNNNKNAFELCHLPANKINLCNKQRWPKKNQFVGTQILTITDQFSDKIDIIARRPLLSILSLYTLYLLHMMTLHR